MTKRYPQVMDGDEVVPRHKDYRMACCDCGLVHAIDFKVMRVVKRNKDGSFTLREPRKGQEFQVLMYPTRNNRATAAFRRARYPKASP